MLAINRSAVASFMLAAASSPAFSQTVLDTQQVETLQAYQDKVYNSALASSNPELDNVLKQLRTVILRVQNTLNQPSLKLQLQNVQISLATGLTVTVGGQVTFFIFTIGAQYSDQTTQTMKFTLIPPPPNKITADMLAQTDNFSTEFTAAILAAAAEANAALKDGLELCTFNADMKFVIQYVLQGGIKVPVALPISANLTGQVNPSTTHEAALTFARKETPPECKAGGGGGGGG